MHMAFLSRGFKNLQWYSMTKQYNPNLVPIGHGFGFIVFMLRVCAVITKQLRPLTNWENRTTMQLTNVS